MKNFKRAKNIPLITALLLSAFSFGPLDANAREDKQGLTLAELKNIIPDLEAQQDGLKVTFAGSIPRRCTDGAGVSMQEGEQNIVMFTVADACKNNFKLDPNEPQESVSAFFQPIVLKDISGSLKIRSKAAGDEKGERRNNEDVFSDAYGVVIQITSTAEEQQRAREQEISAQEEAQRQEVQSIIKNITDLCKRGDYVGMGQAIEQASRFLGDVSNLLMQVDDSLRLSFTKKLKKAKSAEQAKEIYEAYINAAQEKGWDVEALDEDYVSKRFALLDDLVQEKGEETEVAAAAVDELASDLRAMDNDKFYKEHKKDLALSYSDLFAAAAERGEISAAEALAKKAKKFISKADGSKFDEQLSDIYADKFKSCVEKGPWKAESCDDKYAKRSQKYADSRMKSLEGAVKSGSEGAQEDYAVYLQKYSQTFGSGMSYSMPGFGMISQAPGSLQQYKYQQIMVYQQQQQMQYQQQYQQMMMQRMYGNGGGMGNGMGYGMNGGYNPYMNMGYGGMGMYGGGYRGF